MMDEKFSPEQSLQVIHSMIEKVKNQYSENGHLFLLWGWLVLCCSIAQFVLMKFVHYEKHYMVWMACWLAVIYQFFYLRRQHNKQKLRTYTDKIVGFVWISFFILMLLVGITLGRNEGENYYRLVGPVFLALYGVPTFLSGILLRFRPLVVGGIGCWALSVISQFIPNDYHLLLLGAAMVIAWIIPGYTLRSKYNNQNK